MFVMVLVMMLMRVLMSVALAFVERMIMFVMFHDLFHFYTRKGTAHSVQPGCKTGKRMHAFGTGPNICVRDYQHDKNIAILA